MNPTIKAVNTNLKAIGRWLAKADKRLSATGRELATLKRAGMLRGSIWMREGKYPYFVGATGDDGERERRYIGKDPEELLRTQKAIARQERADRLTAERNRLLFRVSRIAERIEYAKPDRQLSW